MTGQELKRYVETAVSLGDTVKVFIPGDWDDRIVEYIEALSKSDELLELIAEDLTPAGQQAFAGSATEVTVTDAKGQVHKFDPGTWVIIGQMVLALLKFIREQRRS